jgi:hypothetical protein
MNTDKTMLLLDALMCLECPNVVGLDSKEPTAALHFVVEYAEK